MPLCFDCRIIAFIQVIYNSLYFSLDLLNSYTVLLGNSIENSTFQVTADFYSHLEFNSKLDSADAIAQALGACNASEEGGDKAQTNNGTSLSGDSKN